MRTLFFFGGYSSNLQYIHQDGQTGALTFLKGFNKSQEANSATLLGL